MPEQRLPGTVQFSVESLLYYAPKIDATGEALASAATTVQRQLLGLGDFFGNSWPDQPFRNSYPRAMYSMLITAQQLADEIQGIAVGIKQMAETYGVTEDQNTADVNRIEVNESRTAGVINHAGGIPAPPSVPNPFDSSPAPAAPQPQAGPSPSAPAPSGTTSSPFGTHPAPNPTPGQSPQAGQTTWKPGFDPRKLEGPWPSGNSGKMEEAAGYWNTLGVALDTAWSDLQRYTAYIMADAQGPAADAFNDYVDGLTGRGNGALTRAIETTQILIDTCLHQAQEVRDLQRQLEQTAIELVVTFVIGQFVSVLTFESTQALSDALDAGIAAKLTSAAEFFEQVTGLACENLDEVIEAGSKVLSQMIVAGRQSALIGFWDTLASDAISDAYGESPGSGTDLLKATLENGLLGAVFGQGSAGGLFGMATGKASLRLIQMGEALKKGESTSPAGERLIGIGMQLKDGGITMSAANAAVSQLIMQHEITPVTFIAGTVSNRFTTAIGPAPGAHNKG